MTLTVPVRQVVRAHAISSNRPRLACWASLALRRCQAVDDHIRQPPDIFPNPCDPGTDTRAAGNDHLVSWSISERYATFAQRQFAYVVRTAGGPVRSI